MTLNVPDIAALLMTKSPPVSVIVQTPFAQPASVGGILKFIVSSEVSVFASKTEFRRLPRPLSAVLVTVSVIAPAATAAKTKNSSVIKIVEIFVIKFFIIGNFFDEKISEIIII